MVCDIHGYMEIRKEGGWEIHKAAKEELDDWTTPSAFEARNYTTFRLLTNGEVRRDCPFDLEDPRGIPDDATQFTLDEYGDGYDYHTASYITLAEAREMLRIVTKVSILDASINPSDWVDTAKFIVDSFPEHKGDPEDLRVVFWFDN